MATRQTKPNLLVIRSADIHQAVTFYQQLGLTFDLHSHGKGPRHYASDADGFVFEIYPQSAAGGETAGTRLGFRVGNVDEAVEALRIIGAKIVSEPTNSEWGRRAVVEDFDQHTVELTQAS